MGQMIHFNGIFHHELSILGYPHLWRPPHGSKHQLGFVKSHILLPLSKRTTGFPPSKACFVVAAWNPKDDGSNQGRWLSALACCETNCRRNIRWCISMSSSVSVLELQKQFPNMFTSLDGLYTNMYVSMYVCIYLCIYVSMYLCIYVSMYLWIYVSMYLCIYVSLYLCIYVPMYLCICVSMYLCIYVPMCLCTYVSMNFMYLWIYVCMNLWMYLCMYDYVCM